MLDESSSVTSRDSMVTILTSFRDIENNIRTKSNDNQNDNVIPTDNNNNNKMCFLILDNRNIYLTMTLSIIVGLCFFFYICYI